MMRTTLNNEANMKTLILNTAIAGSLLWLLIAGISI